MSLSFRSVHPADFPRCLELLAGQGCYDPDVLAELPRLWGELIGRRRLVMDVFEDSARPPSQRLICFVNGTFVTAEFADSLLADPAPFIANAVYRRELAGNTVILDWDRVGSANSGPGVDMLGLDYALERLNLADLTGLGIMPLAAETLRLFIGGYRVRSIHREVFGYEMRIVARMSGWRLRSAYRNHRKAVRSRAGAGHPALLGMTRQEAPGCAGSMASLYFTDPRPIFLFTPAQQDLLTLALHHATDAEAAGHLDISPSTVKKHWEAIFARVAAVGPDWFPRDGSNDERTTRGVEKRRNLLDYLRSHLDEIRPRG